MLKEQDGSIRRGKEAVTVCREKGMVHGSIYIHMYSSIHSGSFYEVLLAPLIIFPPNSRRKFDGWELSDILIHA